MCVCVCVCVCGERERERERERREAGRHIGTQTSSASPAISLGFTILGEIVRNTM